MASYSHYIPYSIPYVMPVLLLLLRYGRSGSRWPLTHLKHQARTSSVAGPSCVGAEGPDQDDIQSRPIGRLPYAF